MTVSKTIASLDNPWGCTIRGSDSAHRPSAVFQKVDRQPRTLLWLIESQDVAADAGEPLQSDVNEEIVQAVGPLCRVDRVELGWPTLRIGHCPALLIQSPPKSAKPWSWHCSAEEPNDEPRPERSWVSKDVVRSVRRHRRTQRRAKIARRCLVRATCQRLVGTSFGCLALTNSKRLWGLPSGSGKGWTPVAAMMRTFMVPFYGDSIEAARDTRDGSFYVSIRRVCENLGIALSSQLEKLKGYHWATTCVDDRQVASTSGNSENLRSCRSPRCRPG